MNSFSDYMSSTFTIEHLLHILLPVAPKWKELGERLFLTKDKLDEIYSNNKENSTCLEKMLMFYISTDVQQDRKDIVNALLKMGEKILATKIDKMDSEHLSTQSQKYTNTPADETSPTPVVVPISESLESVQDRQVTTATLAISVYGKLPTEGIYILHF